MNECLIRNAGMLSVLVSTVADECSRESWDIALRTLILCMLSMLLVCVDSVKSLLQRGTRVLNCLVVPIHSSNSEGSNSFSTSDKKTQFLILRIYLS